MAYEDLQATQGGLQGLDDTSNYDTFMAAGERIIAELRAVVHGEIHPREIDRRDMRHWLKTAWKALPSARVAAALAATQGAAYDDDLPDEATGLPHTRIHADVPTLDIPNAASHASGGDDDGDDEQPELETTDVSDETSETGRFGRYLRKTAGGEWERNADAVDRIETMLRRTGVPWAREPGPEVF